MGSPRAVKRLSIMRKQLLVAAVSGALTFALVACFKGQGSALQWRHGQMALTFSPISKWRQPPPLPWEPLLTPAQLRRGLTFYGSGQRIEQFATKLVAGQPITAVAIGGSVTWGAGASERSRQYPEMFFNFLNTTFPNREHVWLNKGIGGTTSGIFSVCADVLVPEDTDLVVVEFTFNEHPDMNYTTPSRKGFEQLLRKLLRMRNAPAVILLHHYAWYFAFGDDVEAGLYYRRTEEQLGTMAQYYDVPAPSIRNALYSEMLADRKPFKVSKVHVEGRVTSENHEIRAAEEEARKDYYYADSIHPSDTGHQAMAELLAAVVLTAVDSVTSSRQHLPSPREGAGEKAALQLPPPMIPGNAENPTTLCALQEDFKPMAHRLSGFEYKAERPRGRDFVEQKWGYTGGQSGDWIEVEVSTRESPGSRGEATVMLGYLRSYAGMGLAKVDCKAGCKCGRTYMDGLWSPKVSLMQMHEFQVSQHPRCRIRVTIVERRNNTPGGANLERAGYKFQLNAIMVATTPVILSTYHQQAQDVLKSMNS